MPKSSSSERNYSIEFMDGYNYHGPRCRNPYSWDHVTPGEQPQPAKDWDDGWLAKFHGETI